MRESKRQLSQLGQERLETSFTEAFEEGTGAECDSHTCNPSILEGETGE